MKLTLLKNNGILIKSKSLHFITLLVALTVFSNVLKAADYIDTTLISDDKEYNLLIAIPNDYSSSEVYSLVIGLQPCMTLATDNYREALSSLSDSLDMIVVCPDLSETGNWMSDDNYNVILASIDSAMTMYPINPESVYLTGMSCNGATTLQEGLKKVYPFKGIFPYAPYLTSVDPDVMDLNSDIPVTIAVGTNDAYLGNTMKMYDSLKVHGANINLVLIEGIDHTYEFDNFASEMIHSFYYLLDTNSISIAYAENEIPYFEITNTDPAIELTFNITNQADKELEITALSSKPSVVANPDITYNAEDGNVTLNFAPVADKKGKAVIVLEAKEKEGTSYEQITFNVQVNKPVSIEFDASKTLFDVYPNPAKNTIHFTCTEENMVVQIYDVSGEVVLNTIANNNMAIDVSMLKEGMYIVKPTETNTLEAIKFFIK